MKVHECVSFILLRDNKILIEKRKLTKKGDPGLMAIPGGHCKKSESIEQTLSRELHEELGVKFVNCHYICTLFHRSEEFQKIHYYAIHEWSGDIQNNEAESLLWLSFEEIERIDIMADRVSVSEYRRVFISGG